MLFLGMTKNKELIEEVLTEVEYGTLALCKDNIPYSLPINFIYEKGAIYFHGSKKGKKKEYINNNKYASFSIVEPYSVIQSYFSSDSELSCPATHFFRSVSCDGLMIIVQDYDEKVKALELLMKKLQPEGKYIPMENKEIYEKKINGVEVFKLNIENISGKLKLGQNLPKKRFEMVLNYLEKRGYDIDRQTISKMKEYRND